MIIHQNDRQMFQMLKIAALCPNFSKKFLKLVRIDKQARRKVAQ